LIFLRILVRFFLLIELVPETIGSKKKVGFFFIPLFMYSRIRDPVLFYPQDPGGKILGSGSGIRDKTSRIHITALTTCKIRPSRDTFK
jgi:hypothetical protein